MKAAATLERGRQAAEIIRRKNSSPAKPATKPRVPPDVPHNVRTLIRHDGDKYGSNE